LNALTSKAAAMKRARCDGSQQLVHTGIRHRRPKRCKSTFRSARLRIL